MSGLSTVRFGAFSGSGISLRDALAQKVDLVDLDLIARARHPALLPFRLLAVREAARADRDIPFSKTAAWSRGLQRMIPAAVLRRPTLFIQTTAALDLPASIHYAIYTDRLGREGMTSAEFPSRATPGWVEREQRFVEKAERLFVMGPSTKEYAVTEYGISPERVVVVGGAPNARLGARRETGLCRRLLFVGIDWERKGLLDLLDAFSSVAEKHPDLVLDVVGGHPDGPEPDRVRFLGRIPHENMADHFARADLLVIPTHAEPFGIALVEALMMGIPVIGTTVDNQEWIIGGGGLTVEPSDRSALADAIERMVNDYPAMKAKADHRRTELLATMTWERIADRIVSEMLDEGRLS